MRLQTKHVVLGVVGWLLTALCAFGQTSSGTISGQVFTMQGRPAAFAPVRICANTSTGTPCTPTSSIYSDSGLTHALPNPTTADQYGNYSIFVAVGVYVVQITPAPGTTYSYLVSVASGSGGGGGGTPAAPQYAVQYAGPGVTAFNADGTFTFSPSTHGLSAYLTNGGFNSDVAATGGGNNGIANLLAGPCVTVGCLVNRPQTSTDTENIPTALNANTGEYVHVLDSKYGTVSNYFSNFGLNQSGTAERDAMPTTCFTSDLLAQLNNNINCQPIYDIYNGQGRYGQSVAGAAIKARSAVFNVFGVGIGQMNGGTFNANSVGDKAADYVYMNYRGGCVQGADECDEGHVLNMGEQNNPYGSVFSNSHGAGATSINLYPLFYSGALGDGQNLVDMQTPETSGMILSQTTGSGNLPNTATTSDTHAVNTGYGVTTASCGTYTARSNPASSTCTMTSETGTFVTGPACVADQNWEQITITAVSGSTITAGFTYVHPAGVAIEQGGLCGDAVVMLNGGGTPTAPYHITSYAIAGSPTATTFDYVVVNKAGQNGKTQIPVPFLPTMSITGTITRSSNVVSIANPGPNTAFAYNGYVPPSAAAITISGATPSDLNGTVTGTVVTPSTMTWNQAGANETGSGGTVSVTGLNNYAAYCFAETVGVTVQMNTISYPSPSGTVQLEPNHCNWAVNDAVAQPNHYATSVIAHRTIVNGWTPAIPGLAFVANQLQVSGSSWAGQTENILQDFDATNFYQGYGGTHAPHKYLFSNDVYNILFDLKYAPANGGQLFNVGCDPAGCNSNSYDYTLFNLSGNGANDSFKFSPSNNYFTVGSTGASRGGLLSNGYLGAQTAFGLSGQPGVSGTSLPGSAAAPYVGYFTATSGNTSAVWGTGTIGDSTGTLGAKNLIAPNLIAGAQAPANFTIYPSVTGSTTYSYACTAVTAHGESTAGTGTTTIGPATLSSSNYNSISCAGVPGAQSLNVYRTAGGATQGKIANIPNGNGVNNLVANFADTGLAGDGTSPPGTNTTGSFTGYGPTSAFTIGGSPICTVASGCGTSMVYPGAGVPVSTGSAWGTSIATANIPLLNTVNTFTGGTNIFLGSGGGIEIDTTSGGASIFGYPTGGSGFQLNGVTGDGLFNGLTISPFAGSTACVGHNSSGDLVSVACSGGGFITSLTTTGTSGPATVTSGVLNIPQYSGGSSGFPITLGSTSIAASSTTTSVAGLTIDGVTPTTMGYVDATSSIQTQLNAKAPLASPALTGVPTAPTATTGTNTTQIATTAFVLANGYTLPQATTSVLGGVKCDGTTITCTSGVISAVGGGSGNTTSTSLTTNTIPKANGANSIVNSGLTDDGTNLTYTGSGSANGMTMPEGTALGGTASSDAIWADATSHRWLMSNNNGTGTAIVGMSDLASSSLFGVVKVDGTTITASGGVISATGGGVTSTPVSISSGTMAANTCSATPGTATLTGATTSMVAEAGFSGNPASLTGWGSTGGMTFDPWISATNTLSYVLCNQTAASITYSAITFNVGAH